MEDHTITLQTVSAGPNNLCNILIEGIPEWHVRHNALLEESERTHAFCSVDDLIRHDKVPRLDMFLQTTNCRERDDGPNTDFAECCDIGSRRNLMRRELMVKAVSAQESHRNILASHRALVVQNGDGRRGLAPGSVNLKRRNFGEAWKFPQARSANNGDSNVI